MRILFVAVIFGMLMYGAGNDAVGPIAEIVVKNNDGFYAMREIQLWDKTGVPTFKATIHNGTERDRTDPVVNITFVGHDEREPWESISRSIQDPGQMRLVTGGRVAGFLKNSIRPLHCMASSS